MILNTNFSKDEQKQLAYLQKDKLTIYSEIDLECFLLNSKGKYSYEECFGTSESEILKEQRYERLLPKRLLKYYDFFILEDVKEPGSWFVGFLQKNGTIQFLSGYCSLEDAIDGL